MYDDIPSPVYRRRIREKFDDVLPPLLMKMLFSPTRSGLETAISMEDSSSLPAYREDGIGDALAALLFVAGAGDWSDGGGELVVVEEEDAVTLTSECISTLVAVVVVTDTAGALEVDDDEASNGDTPSVS